MSKEEVVIFWMRRDLRLHDNAGLYHALRSGKAVLPLFIFDKNILEELPEDDKRVLFIWQEVSSLKEQLEEKGSSLLIKYGKPKQVFADLIKDYNIQAVFTNRDYEPYAQERDKEIYKLLHGHEIDFKGYKDQVIFDKNEVLKDDGDPYTVYTPYMKKWKAKLTDFYLKSYPNEEYFDQFYQTEPLSEIELEDMGFTPSDFTFPSCEIDKKIIKDYHKTRNIPGIKGTSQLSLHLRFGTISIRKLSRVAQQENKKFFNELIWRDFYQSILYHYPDSLTKAFKPKYDSIKWENDKALFEKWCQGKTGYPLVDAGMRELNESGYMHNRVRMLVASFLTKHLLIDWRWGEAYFAEKLLDYDAASNVGGWQWAAGSGVDAAPYFRIFNPSLQLDKFDPDKKYVKKWVEEYGTDKYPEPIVDHKEARERALERYKSALN